MCGVFGIYGHVNAIDAAVLALRALQHRGQEAAGIAVANGVRQPKVRKGLGTVIQVFSKEVLQDLNERGPFAAIGQTRYSTKGTNTLVNAQPHWAESLQELFAIADNGDMLNLPEQKARLEKMGIDILSGNDAEIKIKTIAAEYLINRVGPLEQAIIAMSEQIQGVYSSCLLTRDKMYAFRDPHGIRPLSLGKLDTGWVVASETCAFDVINAEYIREIEPGEILIFDQNGVRSVNGMKACRKSLCIFEFIYFARPDSIIYDKLLEEARKRMGEELFREYPLEADMVIGIPDTGLPGAMGYSKASGIAYERGCIKNSYIGRSFIEPQQFMREHAVQIKLNFMERVIRGKNLVAVEDSIVRGTTSERIVQMLRQARAEKVHLLLTSPPYKRPCFYAIDTGRREELIAARMSVPEIASKLGVNTLGYLSLDGLYRAIGLERELFCDACFTGDYPIPMEHEPSKFEGE